jgi:hypothetical protein
MKRNLSYVLLFVFGCATGGVASQVAVPPARAGTNPARWEYSCGSLDESQLKGTMNKMGAEGWELVTGSATGPSHVFCFKRPMP